MQTMTQTAQPHYELSDADKKRQKKILDAWRAYHGELDPPLQKMPDQPDDNVMSNRCQPIVDRGIDFLFGKPIGITVEEGAPQEAQDFLETVWGKNESRLPLLQKLAMSGAISGQAFMRIVPGRNDTFRLIVVDPSTVFVQTAPQDCESVQLYCIEYSTTEKINGQPAQVFYHEEIVRIDPTSGDDTEGYADTDTSGYDPDNTWSIQHWTRVGDRGPWQAVGEKPIVWPYAFPPLFSCQNLPYPHEYWGMPDLTPDLISMNNALNLVESNINRVIKIYGQPVLFATGVAESSIDIKPGRIIGLPTTESKISSVPIVSDIVNALKFAETLRSDLDEQSGVPAVATGRIHDLPRGNISGVALEILFMPISQKTEKKRCLYGKIIIDVSTALLILGSFADGIEILLTWQEPVPHDDLAAVQAALAKQQLGVSNETLISEMGYDPTMEMDKTEAENAAKLAQAVPPQPPMPPQEPVSPFIGGHN